jgi:phospholipid transport system substrate-binding protein
MKLFTRRRLFSSFAALVLAAGCVAAAPQFARAQAKAEPSAAQKFVQTLGDRAILELTDPQIADSARVMRMRALLTDSFDKEAVARFVLGTYWNRASEAERGEFVRLYEVLVSYTYAGLFKKYSGETFEVLRERALDGDTVVYAQINQPGSGQAIPIEILVRPTAGAYRAIDIKVEGISMPLTHRKEYASVIQRNQGQVSALLNILREKSASLERGSGS